MKPPHLLVVRAGSSLDPDPVWQRQEAKRGAQWRVHTQIGEEIGVATATIGVS